MHSSLRTPVVPGTRAHLVRFRTFVVLVHGTGVPFRTLVLNALLPHSSGLRHSIASSYYTHTLFSSLESMSYFELQEVSNSLFLKTHIQRQELFQLSSGLLGPCTPELQCPIKLRVMTPRNAHHGHGAYDTTTLKLSIHPRPLDGGCSLGLWAM